MKKLCLFLFLCCATQLSAQVLLNNPNFETLDTSFATGMSGWKSNKFYPTFVDTKQKHSGQISLRMESAAGKNFGAFMQLVPIPKGAAYRKIVLSGFLKRENVEGSTGFWINVFAGKESVAFDNMYNQHLDGTHDWMEVSTSVIVDDKATEMNLGGLLSGTGTVWFDDISVAIFPVQRAPMPDSITTYITEALDLMAKHALYRDSVDWPDLRERTLSIASEAKSYAACYPALSSALMRLGDHHSFLLPADAAAKWQSAGNELEKMPLTTGKMLDGNIAYLSMPGVSSGDEKANTYFADQLQNLLETLDRQKPIGWVFDLRQNTGGNCWPMLAGIGPLLGEGICGYFLTPGAAPESWFYKKGASGAGKRKATKVSRKPYKMSQKLPKVAVITGRQTASSGEVVTVAFRGRPNCRSFGDPTTGLSTGNGNYPLRDGAQIFLCSSVYADRHKTAYGHKITPDSLTPAGENDPALKAATEWLQEGK